MRAFKVIEFARFCRKNRIPEQRLSRAIVEVAAGKVDADLGGGVLKQRLAREGQGKSGGFRTIIFFRRGERIIFAYGFAKNARENLSKPELEAFKALADEFLDYGDDKLGKLIASGEWQEVVLDDGLKTLQERRFGCDPSDG